MAKNVRGSNVRPKPQRMGQSMSNWELRIILFASGQVVLRVCVCVLGTIGSGWLLALAIVDVRRGDFRG